MLSVVEERVITMDPAEAQERLKEYRREIHRRADEEYEAIADGLEAIVEGRRLVDVRNAILEAGFNEAGLPRLAIARADRRVVHAWWNRWGPARVLTFDTNADQGRQFETLTVELSMEAEQVPEHVRKLNGWHSPQGFAVVPLIPASVRRESGVRPTNDRHHFVLWEVEEWEQNRRRARVDRDPYLLRHLGGDLYVVLAAWDLTPLEQAVMAGRREE